MAQQLPTTRNNMQKGVQTCSIQQCWELVANNVASVFTGLYAVLHLSMAALPDACRLNNGDGDDMIEYVNYCTTVKPR